MKEKIHPKYYKDIKVMCSCGNIFKTSSTLKEMRIEFCSKCHPAYSGVKRFLDATRRIEKFKEKLEKIKKINKK